MIFSILLIYGIIGVIWMVILETINQFKVPPELREPFTLKDQILGILYWPFSMYGFFRVLFNRNK